VSLDWKNQYCENYYMTQSNLQIQYNPYQTTNNIFHRTKIKSFTICMETQKKTQITKAILNKTNGAGRNQPSWLQTIPQTYSHQESFLLSQKQNYRSMEQDRNPRDKPTYLWKQEYTKEKRQPLRDSVK